MPVPLKVVDTDPDAVKYVVTRRGIAILEYYYGPDDPENWCHVMCPIELSALPPGFLPIRDAAEGVACFVVYGTAKFVIGQFEKVMDIKEE
jgi:hypothetical protein